MSAGCLVVAALIATRANEDRWKEDGYYDEYDFIFGVSGSVMCGCVVAIELAIMVIMGQLSKQRITPDQSSWTYLTAIKNSFCQRIAHVLICWLCEFAHLKKSLYFTINQQNLMKAFGLVLIISAHCETLFGSCP